MFQEKQNLRFSFYTLFLIALLVLIFVASNSLTVTAKVVDVVNTPKNVEVVQVLNHDFLKENNQPHSPSICFYDEVSNSIRCCFDRKWQSIERNVRIVY